MKKILAVMALALCAVGASAGDKSTDTLVVTPNPAMHCMGCENNIKSNIRFVKGTKKIETSVKEQSVTIIYDKKKAKYKDYVDAFKKIGYEIKVKK